MKSLTFSASTFKKENCLKRKFCMNEQVEDGKICVQRSDAHRERKKYKKL